MRKGNVLTGIPVAISITGLTVAADGLLFVAFDFAAAKRVNVIELEEKEQELFVVQLTLDMSCNLCVCVCEGRQTSYSSSV